MARHAHTNIEIEVEDQQGRTALQPNSLPPSPARGTDTARRVRTTPMNGGKGSTSAV